MHQRQFSFRAAVISRTRTSRKEKAQFDHRHGSRRAEEGSIKNLHNPFFGWLPTNKAMTQFLRRRIFRSSQALSENDTACQLFAEIWHAFSAMSLPQRRGFPPTQSCSEFLSDYIQYTGLRCFSFYSSEIANPGEMKVLDRVLLIIK